MSIPTIPTLEEIKDRIVSDINSKINQTTPSLPKSFNKVLAGAIAGFILLLYQAILWTYRQIFPSTADITAIRLLGALVGITQLPATFSVLVADIGGTNAYSPPEKTLFRSANGTVYKITATEAISSGTASVTLTAQQSGEIGNLINGSVLDIVSPDPQLIGTATVTSTTIDGDDAENPDSLRARVTSEYRKRRTGGAPGDYDSWGLETPNFDWINPLDSPTTAGEVEVYGKVDNQTDGIPTGSQLLQLYDYLTKDPTTGEPDDPTTWKRYRHPIGPDVLTLPITRFLFDVEIFIQGTTPAIESDITTGVENYISTQQPYNIAIDSIKIDTISEGGVADVANDVANPQSATITQVILSQTMPSLIISSYQLFGGEWGKLNSITFTPVV